MKRSSVVENRRSTGRHYSGIVRRWREFSREYRVPVRLRFDRLTEPNHMTFAERSVIFHHFVGRR
jgi:hypothetical protein